MMLNLTDLSADFYDLPRDRNERDVSSNTTRDHKNKSCPVSEGAHSESVKN